MIELGFPSPSRTTIIASTHRLYSIQEKLAIGNAVYPTERLVEGARAFARALHAFDALARLYPKEFSFGKSHRFFGLRSVESDLKSGKSPAEIEKAWQPGLDRFLDARKKCLLYP
jgi:hypothetical protein